MNNISQLPNVVSNVVDFFSHEKVCQGAYMAGILAHLQAELGNEFDEYTFVLFEVEHGDSQYWQKRLGSSSTKKDVVFVLGDEAANIPHELMRNPVYAVFKHYLPAAQTQYSNLFSLPLGYLSATPHYPVVPINKRPVNVFFSGALHYTRLPLLQHFTKFNRLPFRLWNAFYHRFFKEQVSYSRDSHYTDSIIRFNRQGFKSGFASDVFGRLLYDCKIALCPTGVINRETYRHFEALRAGCVVISEPLPDQYYYKGSPIIILNNWQALDEVIQRLLADPVELVRRQLAGLAWWNEVCSEPAVARRIAQQLRQLKEESFTGDDSHTQKLETHK